MRGDRQSRDRNRMTRRGALVVLGALGMAATGALSEPGPAVAQAVGQQETVEAAMKRLFAGRALRDGTGLVKLEVPLIAENGAVVPVAVEVSSPMTPASYVKHIYVVADKNRVPVVSKITLTPEAGLAYVGENVRLGETGEVRAIVEQSDGTLFQVRREVKVTVSGCG